MNDTTLAVARKAKFPDKTAIISLVVGDATAIGAGSRTADVRDWQNAGGGPVANAYVWNKWNDSRAVNAADGTGLDQITSTQGETGADIGLEYGIASSLSKTFEGTGAGTTKAPDIIFIKYGTPDSSLDARATESFNPLALDEYPMLRDNYIADAVDWVKDNYGRVYVDALYVSFGPADALASAPAGGGSAFGSSLRSLVREIARDVGVPGLRTFAVAPPLTDRDLSPSIDLVRYAVEKAAEEDRVLDDYIDADALERFGYDGASRAPGRLSGQAILNLGLSLGRAAWPKENIVLQGIK